MDRFFLGLGPGPDPGSDALRALSPSEPQGSVCGGGMWALALPCSSADDRPEPLIWMLPKPSGPCCSGEMNPMRS